MKKWRFSAFAFCGVSLRHGRYCPCQDFSGISYGFKGGLASPLERTHVGHRSNRVVFALVTLYFLIRSGGGAPTK